VCNFFFFFFSFVLTLFLLFRSQESEYRYVSKYACIPPVLRRTLTSWPRAIVHVPPRTKAQRCCQCFACFSFPFTRFPWWIPFVIMCVGGVLLAIGLVLNVVWLGAPMWTWGAVVMISCLQSLFILLLIRLVILVWLRSRMMDWMKLYYFFNSIDVSLSMVLCAAALFGPLQVCLERRERVLLL
jgi:hypothetical protein